MYLVFIVSYLLLCGHSHQVANLKKMNNKRELVKVSSCVSGLQISRTATIALERAPG